MLRVRHVPDPVHAELAELLGVPLLTADARSARAPGIRCAVVIRSP
jgi:predicted nucleic acid-binding protein